MSEHTIAENLSRLVAAKTDIASAITDMGGTVNQGDGFEEFPEDIRAIGAGVGPVQSDWNQNDSTADDYIKNKPIIPTVNDAVLTIQKNGIAVGTFSANASAGATINITVPVDADDVSALPDTTKYASSLSLSINSTTYVVTASLKDQDGNTLGTSQSIDLPLETVVVGGSYDDTTKKVILTLNNGNTVEFSVADLVEGLQTEITSTNKLSSDLVDDTNSMHKFVTAAEKQKINATHEWTYTEVAAEYDSTSQVVLLRHRAYDEEESEIIDDIFPFYREFPVASTSQAGTMSAADKRKLNSALTSTSSLDPSNLSSAVPVTKGGTGATSASSARTNLGLGSAATYSATSSVTSGSSSLVTSGAVYSTLFSKTATISAGTNITIVYEDTAFISNVFMFNITLKRSVALSQGMTFTLLTINLGTPSHKNSRTVQCIANGNPQNVWFNTSDDKMYIKTLTDIPADTNIFLSGVIVV